MTLSGLAITGITGSDNSAATDYTLSASSKNVAATITTATLTPTVTNTNVTKGYDGTTAAPAGFTPTYSLAGFVSGDTAATLSIGLWTKAILTSRVSWTQTTSGMSFDWAKGSSCLLFGSFFTLEDHFLLLT